MRQPSRVTLQIAAIAIALLGGLTTLPGAAADEPAAGPERFVANAMSLGGLRVGGGSARSGVTRVTFTVERTSTDAEREQLLAAVRSGGSAELHKVLGKMAAVGRVQIEGRLGYDLRYAREVTEEGGQRHLILATDRPIQFAEIMGATRSRDYDIAVVELIVDAEGKGSGAAIPAAQVVLDEESGDIQLINLSTSPVQLNSVRRSK